MCLGRTHTLSGAAAWLLGAPVASAVFGFELPVTVIDTAGWHLNLGVAPVMAVGAAMAGGAAQLPDTDHPCSSIAHALGPVTRVICRAVSRVFDHRGPTHYLVAVPVWALLAVLFCRARLDLLEIPARLAASWWPDTAAVAVHRFVVDWGDWQLGLFLTVGLLSAWGLRLLFRDLDRSFAGSGELIAGAVIAAAAMWWIPTGGWVFVAVAIGVLAHALGDCTTEGGVRLLWPLPWVFSGRYSTGSGFERMIVIPALIVLATVLTWVRVVWPLAAPVVGPLLATGPL